MLTEPCVPPGCPQPETPESRCTALAGKLQVSDTDRGIVGGILPCGPFSRIALRTLLSCGSTSTKGTPSTAFGPQSGKTIRSVVELSSWNMPLVLTTVATLSSGIGT